MSGFLWREVYWGEVSFDSNKLRSIDVRLTKTTLYLYWTTLYQFQIYLSYLKGRRAVACVPVRLAVQLIT